MRQERLGFLRWFTLILSLAILVMQGFIIYKTAEVNRLLASFQRIDTVKGAEKICSYPKSIDGMPLCDVEYHANTSSTSAAVRFSHSNAAGNINKSISGLIMEDPNICSRWQSICSDKKCRVICAMDLDDE